MAEVTALFVYPVKSTRRLPLDEVEVERRGLRHDRRWLIVDPGGEFLSQRELAQLATLCATPEDSGLRLAIEGKGEVHVSNPKGESRRVVIWDDTVDAIDAGDAVAEWLTRSLGTEARLVHMPDTTRRPVQPAYALDGDLVSFADGLPVLLTNEASLDDLNSRLDVPVPMERFRPNVVVTGFDAWAENSWSAIQIGSVRFRCPKTCGRCIVTTTDQDTGERKGPEPLTTLATFDPAGKSAVFGRYLTPDAEGVVKVGDAVTVL